MKSWMPAKYNWSTISPIDAVFRFATSRPPVLAGLDGQWPDLNRLVAGFALGAQFPVLSFPRCFILISIFQFAIVLVYEQTSLDRPQVWEENHEADCHLGCCRHDVDVDGHARVRSEGPSLHREVQS